MESGRQGLLFRQQFEVIEKSRKVAAMENLIADFERNANDLMRQIAEEEKSTGIRNCADFAYSTFAKTARFRRDKLLKSAEELKVALYAVRREHENATAEVSRRSPSRTRSAVGKSIGKSMSPGNS